MKRLLVVLSLLALAGCGGNSLDDIEPIEVETEDSVDSINQEDLNVESDNIIPSVNGPSTPPSVNGPTSPPPSR